MFAILDKTSGAYHVRCHRAIRIIAEHIRPKLDPVELQSAQTLGFPGGDFPLHDQEARSGEHTSELQSPCNLVCRLLLGKKTKYLVNPCLARAARLLERHVPASTHRPATIHNHRLVGLQHDSALPPLRRPIMALRTSY